VAHTPPPSFLTDFGGPAVVLSPGYHTWWHRGHTQSVTIGEAVIPTSGKAGKALVRLGECRKVLWPGPGGEGEQGTSLHDGAATRTHPLYAS